MSKRPEPRYRPYTPKEFNEVFKNRVADPYTNRKKSIYVRKKGSTRFFHIQSFSYNEELFIQNEPSYVVLKAGVERGEKTEFPSYVTDLVSLFENYEYENFTPFGIKERMTVEQFLSIPTYGFDIRRRVSCPSGLCLHIQAGKDFKSAPNKDNATDYFYVEVEVTSRHRVRTLQEFHKGGRVYDYVPLNKLERVVRWHGGLDTFSL